MNASKIPLLDCEYFPCISWYKTFINSDKAIIESNENFVKATYRNRCEIIGPNGKINLSVPLDKGRDQRRIIKDIKIGNKEKWQKLHWKTLCTSYRRTPYFEYYEEELKVFFEKEYTYLFDFNMEIILFINKLLKIKTEINFTSNYIKNYEPPILDYRGEFYVKAPVTANLPSYIQNFQERNGFMQNLSILDMLFSCGVHTTQLLMTEL